MEEEARGNWQQLSSGAAVCILKGFFGPRRLHAPEGTEALLGLGSGEQVRST